MGSLEDALYLTSPLATSNPQVIRSEILANGAPPQMTKDGPKPATRKIIAQAAARKEGFLRAVLDAKRLRGYDCDWLVQPLCLGVFRRDNSTTEQSRLAIEVLRECNSLDPSDEPVLAETIRLGIVERKVTGLRINNLGVSDTPSTSVSGGSSQRTAVHFKVLTLAPARVGAVVLWRERERFVKLISGENVSISETETGSRVAAIVAAGACLSRVDGVERLVQYAPSHTDATGARGDGARFLIDVWRRIVIVAEDTRAPDQVTVAACNALALLLGPALGDAHPTVTRLLAAHARDPEMHGEYTGPRFTLGGENCADLGCSGSSQFAWGDAGWAKSSARGDGVAARGPATPMTGDDPLGSMSPTLAAIRLDVTMRVVARAKNLAQRATRVPIGDRPITAGVLVTALCAALEHATAGEVDDSEPSVSSPVSSPKKPQGKFKQGSSTATYGSSLGNLRDASRARAFDDAGGVVGLVEDSPGARKELLKLAGAGADYVGEALLRPVAVHAAQSGGRGDPKIALAGGAGLLALSGSLPTDQQPLDWVPMGSSALLSVVENNKIPELNDDGKITERKKEDVHHALEQSDGRGKKVSNVPSQPTTTPPASPDLDSYLGDEPTPPVDTGKDAAKKSDGGKELPMETRRLPREARDAIAPLSRAAFLLAVADALPSMPISQPLRAIRALVHESKRGLPSRRDVRVAIVARALTTHASLRTHPEAIVVMTPLGEIIGTLMEDDGRSVRIAAERTRLAAERAAAAAGVTLDMDDLSLTGMTDPSTLKSQKKRQEAFDANQVINKLRQDARNADAAANAPQFREEVAICAVEAVLKARPGNIEGFSYEAKAASEKRAGWCQVALEAAATLRRAALWPASATGGRRAACDASMRLLAHLCAATRAAVAEGKRVEAPGVHAAAQRVLAALVQETVLAQKDGTTDDAASASVAYVACAHLDFPNDKNEKNDSSGANSLAQLEDSDMSENLSRQRERASDTKGGLHGPLVVAMVEGLLCGGAARFTRRVQNAAAQRNSGSMFFEANRNTPSERRHLSTDQTISVGLACVELLGQRCPSLADTLIQLLEGSLRSGGFDDAGPSIGARARNLSQRLRNSNSFGDKEFSTPTPDVISDPKTRPSFVPPPVLLGHLVSSDGAVSGSRWVNGKASGSVREHGTAAAAAAADFAMLVAARDATEAAARLVAKAERREKKGGRKGEANSSEETFKHSKPSPPLPLTGPCDPLWIEASHSVIPATRTARVAFRCRPPPPSNESGAAGAAGLSGTLRVGTHGECAFSNDTHSITVELAGESAKVNAANAARDVVGVSGVGADGGAAFASLAGNGGYVGHRVKRSGVGVDEECVIEVDVNVKSFGPVGIRPIVTYPNQVNMHSGSPGDGAPQPTLRCVEYALPLSKLLVPNENLQNDPSRFEELWALLPSTFELGCVVDLAQAQSEGYSVPDAIHLNALGAPDVDRAIINVAVAALGGETETKAKRRNSKKTQYPKPFARCGGYALGSAGVACERFAAVTWDGEHLLCALFASSWGVRLEYRARSPATLAPIAADPSGWLADVAGKALVVADFDTETAGDATLFRPTMTATAEMLANGPQAGNGVKLRDAAAQEWKAMTVA